MTRTLKNFYFESQISILLDQEATQLGFTQSKFLRLILKQHYNLCAVDNCLNKIFAGSFCEIHSHSKNGWKKILLENKND